MRTFFPLQFIGGDEKEDGRGGGGDSHVNGLRGRGGNPFNRPFTFSFLEKKGRSGGGGDVGSD